MIFICFHLFVLNMRFFICHKIDQWRQNIFVNWNKFFKLKFFLFLWHFEGMKVEICHLPWTKKLTCFNGTFSIIWSFEYKKILQKVALNIFYFFLFKIQLHAQQHKNLQSVFWRLQLAKQLKKLISSTCSNLIQDSWKRSSNVMNSIQYSLYIVFTLKVYALSINDEKVKNVHIP